MAQQQGALMPMSKTTDATWHLDRKVPISIIIVVLIQLVSVILFAAKLDGRVSTLEATEIRQEQIMASRFKLGDERYDNILKERDRLIRVEEQLKFQSDVLSRIEGKVSGRLVR